MTVAETVLTNVNPQTWKRSVDRRRRISVEANDTMQHLDCAKAVLAGALLGALLLCACHKGGGEGDTANSDAYGSNPFPNGVPGLKLEFTRYELTGLSGPPAVEIGRASCR